MVETRSPAVAASAELAWADFDAQPTIIASTGNAEPNSGVGSFTAEATTTSHHAPSSAVNGASQHGVSWVRTYSDASSFNDVFALRLQSRGGHLHRDDFFAADSGESRVVNFDSIDLKTSKRNALQSHSASSITLMTVRSLRGSGPIER